MLDIQQCVLTHEPATRLPQFATKLDEGPMGGRRMLAQLCATEASQGDFVLPVAKLVPDEETTPAMRLRAT